MSTTNISNAKIYCDKVVKDQFLPKVNEHGTLLYLALAGSHLHGTATENSDYDIKGIYLPYRNQMLFGNHTKSINIQDEESNIDFECWSLQYISYLLTKGDSNIIDLLYSQTFKDAILYNNNLFLKYFTLNDIKDKLLFNNMTGIVGYCLNQAEKYTVKIKTIKILNEILECISKLNVDHTNKLDLILKNLPTYPDEHVYITNINNLIYYKIYGKLYQSTIKIDSFINQINKRIDDYGNRSKNAFDFKSCDFKSMAHAYRAGIQYKQLLNEKVLTFPLKERDTLLKIKNGEFEFDTVREMIKSIINEITKIDDGSVFNRNKPDIKFIQNNIISIYNQIN